MITLLRISLLAWLWLTIEASTAAQSSSLTVVSLLSRTDVQVELGLSEEMRKAIATHESSLAEYREPQDWRKIAEADARVWQKLKPQLSTMQFERLVGLMLQARGYTALIDDEVVTALQLATDPLPALRQALRNQQNWPNLCADFQNTVAASLSDEVQSRIEELKGEPFKFSPALPLHTSSMATANSKGGMNLLGPLAALALQPDVREELKISEVVLSKLSALIDDISEVSALALRETDWRLEADYSQPESQASWRALVEKFETNRCQLESELKTLLGEEKLQRLVGLLWQREGDGALLVSHTAAMSLDLSDKQLVELIELKSNFMQHRNISHLTLSSLPSVDLESILTSEQREQIERLKGAPITFVESTAEMVARASEAYKRGSDASKKGEYAISIKEYDEAVRLAPKNSTYLNNRGMIRQRLGLLQEALDDHNNVLAMSPTYKAGYYQRFQAFLRLGDIDRAIADLRELTYIDPTTRNHQLLAMTLAEAGQPQAAAEAYALADVKLNTQYSPPLRSVSPPLVATQSALAGAAVSGWHPSWSPDGKEIVRGRNYHEKLEALEIVDLNSGEVRLLCENGSFGSWSPVVGGPIAFVRGTAPFGEIWLIEVDSTTPRKIADGGYPTWTSDGRLFYRVEGDTLKNQPSRLVSIHPDNPGVELSSCDINDKYPAVSNDGSLYATFNTQQLEVRETETGKLLASVPHHPEISGVASFSPNGGYLCFGSLNSTHPGLWMLEIASQRVLLVSSVMFNAPHWSPDGKTLAADDHARSQILFLPIDQATLPDLFEKQVYIDINQVAKAAPEHLLTHVDTTKLSRLRGIVGMDISRDGQYLYSASYISSAVHVFRRDLASGHLTLVEEQVDTANLKGATDIRLSFDGNYAVTSAFTSKAVGLYQRDRESGKLTQLDVARDNQQGVTGLNWAIRGTFSPDSKHIYVANSGRALEPASVTAFAIEGNKLKFIEMLRGENSCFDNARGLCMHPDGRSLFVTSSNGNTLVALNRQAETGQLSIGQILRNGQDGIQCLAGAMSVAVSNDGRYVYTLSGRFRGVHAVGVYVFDENQQLTMLEEHSVENGRMQGLAGGNQLAVTSDGKQLIAVGTISGSLAVFDRDPSTGKLKFIESIAHNPSWKNSVAGVCVSPDSRFVYVSGGEKDTSITVFAVKQE